MADVQVKDQIVVVLLLYAVMKPHDVGVLQFSANPGLSFQLLEVCNRNGMGTDIQDSSERRRTDGQTDRWRAYLGMSISLC